MNKLYVDNEESSFIVVIDGKKDVLLSGDNMSLDNVLRALPAKGFSSIEVLLAPPERYGVKYVVDVKTDKKVRIFGVVGETGGIYDVELGRTLLSQGLLGSADKLRFSIGGRFDNMNRPEVKAFINRHELSSESFLQQSTALITVN